MGKDKKLNNNPEHIAVTLDGNRRFAKKLGLKIIKGHELGFEKIMEMLDWCLEFGVKELTLYCFSTENFNRSKEEVNALFNLFRSRVDKLMEDERIHKNEVGIRIIGDVSKFPADMQDKLNEVMERTSSYHQFRLNLALAYGGRAEIVNVVNRLLKGGIKEVTEEEFNDYLWLNSAPDLWIRPGGEKRLSNFLIWQSAYSELVFLKTLWPEFSKQDFIDCIEEYKRRQRRFGE